MAKFSDDRPHLLRYMYSPSSSITEFLAEHKPEALAWTRAANNSVPDGITHGTTIVALKFAGGAVIAGDRQATSGTSVGYRYARKVYPVDATSCIGVAGTSALAFDMVRLFQLEVEHYEKIEGSSLSLVGRANKLAGMVRQNLPMAMQGLAVVPVYVGYDDESDSARIFSYDPAGAMTEEYEGYHSIGSGSLFAMGSLKKLYAEDLGEDGAIAVALEALYDAAESDTATMLPDLGRGIFPTLHVVTSDGERGLTDDEIATVVQGILDRRRRQPDGPRASITT
ncbi:proteasome subunit beta [Nocardia sp. BMG51109]|uniref:proteasome subunit beta n=1 Tax=Nocardia sp. BMG51109 TaxID=1056816 RepID=UPI0009FF522A|nr:proteasome subunit beta [Nocardia sp. BMG51109]